MAIAWDEEQRNGDQKVFVQLTVVIVAGLSMFKERSNNVTKDGEQGIEIPRTPSKACPSESSYPDSDVGDIEECESQKKVPCKYIKERKSGDLGLTVLTPCEFPPMNLWVEFQEQENQMKE